MAENIDYFKLFKKFEKSDLPKLKELTLKDFCEIKYEPPKITDEEMKILLAYNSN